MPGLGTIVNIAAIVVGGLLGLLFGNKIGKGIQETLTAACGVSTMFLGTAGALEHMLTVTDGHLTSGGAMLIIVSMALGGLIGALVNLDGNIERFGAWLRNRTGNGEDSRFLDGFVTASLTVCVGAMAVVGSIQDGLYADHSTLFMKSVLDFMMVMVLTASMGKGCIFSAVSVALFQGAFTLMAKWLEPVMTAAASANLSMVGSILIFCVGVNLVWGPKIKVANMLPALVIAVGASFLPWF